MCQCIGTCIYCTARVIPFPPLCLPSQDVSCNEIQVLPAQVGRLQALRELNIRKNCLHMLPEGQSNFPFFFFISLLYMCPIIFGKHTSPLKNHRYSVNVGCHVTISAAKTTLMKTNNMSRAMMSHNTSEGSLKYNKSCLNTTNHAASDFVYIL